MNTISFPHKGDPGNGRTSKEDMQEITHQYNHELNISEGGEFLDDAIRMKDQPLRETGTIETE